MDLESIIKKYVQLYQHPSKKGWYPVVCKVCKDHGKKGPRAAFHFQNGSVGYNCFNDPNCNASYDCNQNFPLSKSMERLLIAYNIPESEYEWINVEALSNEKTPTQNKKQIKLIPDEIQLQRFFVKMSEVDENDKWRIIAEDYLSSRGIDPTSYPFYLSFKDELPHWKKWYGRLIIPIYDNNNRLIYYTGRALTDAIKKYDSPPSTDKEIVCYGYDEIYKKTNDPLYIVEGFFDAFHINGVALFGNIISEGMLYHLNNCPKPKVVIPDKWGKGYNLALQGLKEGWSISTPDIGNCKDINDAVVRFGRLYTMSSIIENTNNGFAAELALKIYCKDFK